MAIDVRKSLTDAGYIAVGVGVLGIQQIQERSREIQTKMAGTGSPLHVIGDQTNDLRLKVKAGLDRAPEAAQDFGAQVAVSAKPVVLDLAERAEVLPQPIPKAVAPAVKLAKTLVGA